MLENSAHAAILRTYAAHADHLPYVRGYGWLAKKYRCPVSTARDICTYRTRVAG